MPYKIGTIMMVSGSLLITLGFSMLIPLLIAFIYSEDKAFDAFLLSICIALIAGLMFRIYSRLSRSNSMKTRDGFVIVSICWLIATAMGAIPYCLCEIASPIDAFFESVSGFTTTGATIIENIEVLPRSILFWRSFTQWIGGMGLIIFITAIFPKFGFAGQVIAIHELAGPIKEKSSAKFTEFSRNLYKVYIFITVIQIILLKIAGMTLFDSVIHTFGTVSSGGFSSYNDNIAHFDDFFVQFILIIFMLIGAMNFLFYFSSRKRGFIYMVKDEETRLYVIIAGIAALLIFTYNAVFYNMLDLGTRFMDSIFQVVSLITSTGFRTVDYNLWPTFPKFILLLLFFVGGCSSSTGGGLKSIRVLVALKLIKRGVSLKIHPHRIAPLTLNEKELNTDSVISISNFIFTYVTIFIAATLLLSINGFDLITNATASLACLCNVGPGLSMVGPFESYAFFSGFSKLVCCFLMIAGRLELFTVLALFSRNYWKPDSIR